MYLYVRTTACMCGHVVHTGIDMCVYSDRCHAHRCVHVYLSPSIQLNIYVHGHPSIFRYMYFGAASRRACGRAVAAGARAGALARAASASGYNRRSECVGVPITRMRVCVRAMRGDFPVASARSAPRLPIVARRARAARARGARQVHLLHEGEGAPRVARPVQALGDPVRPAAAAAVRVRGGAGAALPRVRAAPGAGPAPCGVDAAAAVLLPARMSAPAADRRALGVGPEPLGVAAVWRAGTRTTPSSRRCRRRSTGPT
jgi:hypothetical protein